MGTLTMAVCIPTYERRDIVEDFLNNCYDTYTAAGIDLYFYDSSMGNDTQTLIQEWLPKGQLHYIRLPSDMHPNAKAYKIFQGYGLEKEYDFIFLSADAVIYLQKDIQRIVEQLNLNFDVISIDCSNASQKTNRIYKNPDEYMVQCVYNLATFGRVILNRRTMLHNVDWERYQREYLTEPITPWSHVSFYLGRIVEIDSFTGIDLFLPGAFRISRLKKSMCWSQKFLWNICEGWVQTIESLPTNYLHKAEAIREQGERDLPDLFSFLQLKRYGSFNLIDCIKLKKGLQKITALSMNKLIAVSIFPQIALNTFYGLRKKHKVKALKRFCYRHRKIWVYGTGTLGEAFARFLEECGIEYAGFCVTNSSELSIHFRNHPVFGITQLLNTETDIGIIVAMYQKNANVVLKGLESEKIRRTDIFYDISLNNEILFQYDYFFLRP